MTRLIGPDEGSREVKSIVGGVFRSKAGRPAQLWADEAATVPADVLTLGGAVIPASTVTIDSSSMLPLFQFPDGDVDVVYGTVDGGPAWPVYARTDDRLDTLGSRVTTVEGVAAAAETPAEAQAKADAARAAAIADAATKYPTHEPKLRKWYGALANRHASIASIVVIGDSISEGTGVTSIRRRWQQVLQAELRGRFQPPGVTGATVPFIPATPRLTPIPADYGVTQSGAPTQQSFGLGLKAAGVVAGQSVTWTFTGTRAKLYGTKGPQPVGKYSIVLDGAAEVVVDGFQASTANGQLIWDSGPLTAGSHTVVVARASSTTFSPGTVYPEGLMIYNGDESSGVRVVDGSRHGLKASAFNQNPAWQAALGAVEGKGLLILPWGANEATGGTSAATFRADLETLIAAARTAGFAGSILLLKMPKRQGVVEQLWTDYRAQIDAIAAADPDITTLDLRSRMPDVGTTEATTLGLYVDDVHPTDKGHGWIADQIATAIMPR